MVFVPVLDTNENGMNNLKIFDCMLKTLKTLFLDEHSAIEEVLDDSFLDTLYGKVVVALAGGLEYVCKKMKKISFMHSQDLNELNRSIKILNFCAKLVEDGDNACHFAQLGGHLRLLDIMKSSCHDEIQEGCSEIIATCSVSCPPGTGFAFPYRNLELEPPVRKMPFQLIYPFDSLAKIDVENPITISTSTSIHTHTQPTVVSTNEEENPQPSSFKNQNQKDALVVLIREIPTRMTGQPTTGYRLWGGTFILSRWINKNSIVFQDKRVLEVGSGLGLAGNVVANYAKSVILSDYNQETLEALHYNVDLNECWKIPSIVGTLASKVFPLYHPRCVGVMPLDWDHLDVATSFLVDIIIASDVICEPSTAIGYMNVLRHFLHPQGIAYLVNANSKSRFGVEQLLQLFQDSEFQVSIETINSMKDAQELMQDVYDSNEVVYDLYTIRFR